MLNTEYVINEKTIFQIAKEHNYAIGTIFNYLKKYNIPTRKTMTEKTKAKISKSQLGKVSKLKGIKLSKEHRKNISNAKMGKYRINTEFGGHEKRRKDGYISIYLPTHPNCNKEGYVMKHHLVMEKEIGRLIMPNEVVHHKNHIRDDNRIENLELMTHSEHARLHMIERQKRRRLQLTK